MPADELVSATRHGVRARRARSQPAALTIGAFLSYLLLPLVLLVASVLPGDSSTASLRVFISDPSVGSVTLEVSHDRDPHRRWSTTLQGGDSGRLTGLPPGVCRVRASAASGSGQIDLELAAGDIVSVSVERAAGGLRLVLRDAERAAVGDLDARTLDRLPSGSGVWGLIDSASPFVIADRIDTGGLSLGISPRVAGRAASWTSAAVEMGGDAIPNAGGIDRLAIEPDISSLEAVRVLTGVVSAESSGPGARIVVVPKRPGPTRQTKFDVTFTAPGMVAGNNTVSAPSIARLDSWGGASLQSGGPIGPRAGLFVSGSANGMRAQERERAALVPATVATAFAHFVAAPMERMHLGVLGYVARVTRPYAAWPSRVSGIAERDVSGRTHINWEHQSVSGRRLAAEFGYQRTTFTPADDVPSQVAIDRVHDSIPPLTTAWTVSRTEGRASLAFAPFGRHDIDAGVFAARTSAAAGPTIPLQVAELAGGLPARIWLPQLPGMSSQRATTQLAAYIEDRFQARSNLTLTMSARLSRSSGEAAGALSPIVWTGVQPRISLRWKTAAATLFAAYSRFQDDVRDGVLAFGDPGEAVRDVYRWDDRNRNGTFDAGERGALVLRAGRGPAVASIDPSLEAPHADELTFGAERALGSRMSLAVTGVVRRERSLLRAINAGAPFSSYQVRTIPDQGEDWDSPSDNRLLAVYDRLPSTFGDDRYVLTNSPEESTAYDGIEVTWRARSPRWWSFAGASMSRSEGAASAPGFWAHQNDPGVLDALEATPNAAIYPRGRLFFDRAYVLKWAGGFDGPHDLRFGFVARYQDGQPFSRLVVVPDLAQGPEVVSAYANGRTRFTFTTTVDMRIEKGLTIGTLRAAIRLELYNVTNLGLEVEENPLTGPDFRRTTAVQPPRTARIGLRIEF